MRLFALLPLLLALGCDGDDGDGPVRAPVRGLPVLDAHRVEPGAIRIDGKLDTAWKKIRRDLPLALTGTGPAEVRLKAAHDGNRLFLLAIWEDKERSLNRFWRYQGQLKWEKHVGEDAFSVLWSPGSLQNEFREQGCAMFCHGGRHQYPHRGRGFADVWFYGTHQCSLTNQARDMWLPFGPEHQLRGDRQPADSDNLPNLSQLYEGPRYWPRRINASVTRLLTRDNLAEVTPDHIRKNLTDEKNTGREIPLDILQARRGSRGDVTYEAAYYKGKHYVLELSRLLNTGNPDDIVLDASDPLVTVPFAVALHDGTAGGEHSISGPVELRFVTDK